MTIGFGDFVPGNSYIYNKTGSISEVHNIQGTYLLFYIQQIIVIIQLFGIKVEGNFKLVLGSIYLLLGLAIIAMVFNLMGEKLSTQV